MPFSLIFAGTPQFSVPALEALVGSKHRVVCVYTQPDRPAGRGRRVQMSAVKECALRHGLPVEQPQTLREIAAVDRLASWQADLMIVVAYGLMLPAAVLRVPRLGCLNIHASLLPRWRGAAPIQRAILAGDAVTGVTIMQMDEGLDTGPMLLELPTSIHPHETAARLHDRLATLGADALLAALDQFETGALRPRAQPADGAAYASKIRKEEALIDWSCSAVEIDRQVRAFNPWPIAETRWRAEQLRIWEAFPAGAGAPAAPGTVIGAGPAGVEVATGEGVLRLTRLQAPGRKPVSALEFLNAHPLDGAVFGS
ncbi:MAG TPA: methionyl-tRNA formyltransferase [Steroidobacter sp.]|jgi:methionyl-tRNA formyltransferase|nr:methionyl-tRNA formyltransferase [Steroidobacter sp.]